MNELKNLHTFEENGICQATPSALLKFKISEILANYDKIIYLDGDILVQKDLTELYNIDIDGYYVAAVDDTGKIYHKKDVYAKYPNYFNSGVMLLNLKKCREDNISSKLPYGFCEFNVKAREALSLNSFFGIH